MVLSLQTNICTQTMEKHMKKVVKRQYWNLTNSRDACVQQKNESSYGVSAKDFGEIMAMGQNHKSVESNRIVNHDVTKMLRY